MGINGHNELLQIRKWRWFAVIANSNIVRGLALGIERTEEMGISKHTKKNRYRETHRRKGYRETHRKKGLDKRTDETDVEKNTEETGVEKNTAETGVEKTQQKRV